MTALAPADRQAEMYADWPTHIQLAARVRDLEEALAAAEERAQDERRRRESAERTAETWRQIARDAGVTAACQHLHVTPDRRVESYQLAAQRSHEQAERAEARALRWRNDAEKVGAVLRRLTRLPVPLSTLPADEVYALAWALAPIRGEKVALPAETVSEICRRAVEMHLRIEQLAGGEPRVGVEAYRAQALTRYGIPAASETDPQASLFGAPA